MAMIELRRGEGIIRHDVEATMAAYRELAGQESRCTCSLCRNFAAQRKRVFPAAILELFSTLGINPDREGELFDYGKDPYTGLYNYGGWYYFVGELVKPGGMEDFDGFLFEFGVDFPEPPAPFEGKPVLAIDFTVPLPWVIDEPEPLQVRGRQS